MASNVRKRESSLVEHSVKPLTKKFHQISSDILMLEEVHENQVLNADKKNIDTTGVRYGLLGNAARTQLRSLRRSQAAYIWEDKASEQGRLLRHAINGLYVCSRLSY